MQFSITNTIKYDQSWNIENGEEWKMEFPVDSWYDDVSHLGERSTTQEAPMFHASCIIYTIYAIFNNQYDQIRSILKHWNIGASCVVNYTTGVYYLTISWIYTLKPQWQYLPRYSPGTTITNTIKYDQSWNIETLEPLVLSIFPLNVIRHHIENCINRVNYTTGVYYLTISWIYTLKPQWQYLPRYHSRQTMANITTCTSNPTWSY
jgi:hypothetical protein